ncbi:hypothetical protein [Sphingomonas sp. AX6]|uniref:hypothetical protein n=1 Tax=Sphingomonas sp. AX6 TaxID=2653171 RepID=UPI0012F1020F|nr:hypothetical protein [Sphingomonas sp. AX6]VXC63509.1 conserved hypothetical protein [Sphingomonas sp. AX6]
MGFVVSKPQAGPTWLPVVGGEVLFAPIDRTLVRRARRKALEQLGRDVHGPSAEGETDDFVIQMEDLGDALSCAMILEGAQDWKGAMEEVDGTFVPLTFSREALADMLADPVYFDALDAAYVMPYVRREREKNVSAASPNGSGAAAIGAKGTASTAATPKPKAAAKRARTASTSLKRSKPKVSGTS